MKSLITFGLVLWFGSAGFSQQILSSYVDEALQNNQQLLQEAMRVRSSHEALGEAGGLYLPSVDFMADYTLADGGRSIGFPVGDLFNPVYGTLNQLTESNTFPTDLENVNEQFLPNDFHETKIRVVQPLFNSDIYYNRKAAQQLLKVSEARKAAYEKELIKEVKVAYFNHLQALESVGIYEANATVLEEAERFNQRRFEQGVITRDEVYRISSELADIQADKALAREQVVTSKAYFNFLLDRPVNTDILVDSTLDVTELEHDISIDQALQQRQELDEVRAAQEAQYHAINLAKGAKLPQVNGVLDLGYQGFGYSFDSEQQYYLVNFSVSWNLFKGFQNQRKVQRQRIELERLESQETQLKKRIALEVTQSYQAFVAANKRYDAAVIKVRSARKSYEITDKRYLEGQALLVEYLDAQSNLLSADLQWSISRYAVLASEAELQRAMAY